MPNTDFSALSDAELLEFAKQNQPSPLVDAFIIGFLIGILIFAAAVNGWGLVMLIPLFMIRAFLKKPKRHEALMSELKMRNLE
jgi:hypothetical protein